jgi:hypothetical protein
MIGGHGQPDFLYAVHIQSKRSPYNVRSRNEPRGASAAGIMIAAAMPSMT